MTVSRMVGLLLIFGSLAIGVVGLRAEQARTARRIQAAQYELVRIRRELWSVQMAIARRKSPGQIGVEVNEMVLDVAPPVPPEPGQSEGKAWASRR